jgi:hypothetical protein
VVAIGQLFLWSAKRGEWTNCPHEEITWLDRALLSGNEDLTLHRAPRCAGLRYVHHGWELFSRDTSHRVYLAPDVAGLVPARMWSGGRRATCPPLPGAPCPLLVSLDGGLWLVSVGSWVVRLRHEVPERPRVEPARGGDSGAVTRESEVTRRGVAPGPDAVARVRSYFQRNAGARLAIAYTTRNSFSSACPATCADDQRGHRA